MTNEIVMDTNGLF